MSQWGAQTLSWSSFKVDALGRPGREKKFVGVVFSTASVRSLAWPIDVRRAMTDNCARNKRQRFMLLQDHHFITEAQWIIIKVSIQMARWMPVDLLSAAASTRVIKLLYTRPRDWPLTTHLQQYFTLSYLSAQCCLAHLLNEWLAELCMLKRISTQNMVTKSPDKAIYGRWIVNLNF